MTIIDIKKPEIVFEHQDILEPLNRNLPIKEKLVYAHKALQRFFPFIDRIAVAIYDPKTSILKSYVHSSGEDDPLSNYSVQLDDAPSLKEVLDKNRPRIVKNMVTFEDDDDVHEHTRRIGRQGYASSYTMPMFFNGVFFGFIFFNSYEKDPFNNDVLCQLDIYGHMLSLMVINEISAVRTLIAAVSTTSKITHVRDAETGSHLDRMSRYARLIASELAQDYQLNDDYIEHIFMFSPLHDIGKIGIPDSILLKQGKLNDDEASIMKTHAVLGREMIDDMLRSFGLGGIPYAEILRNIAEFHHEAVNGSGYPTGKKYDQIPLEARIVAVADVFDALTSRRPYKDAWSIDEAISWLQRMAGEKLDVDCVNALIRNREKIEKIHQQFSENLLG